ACASDTPASCECPPAQIALLKRRTLPSVGRPRPFWSAAPTIRFVTTKAYSVASLSGLLVVGFVAAAGCTPTTNDAHTLEPVAVSWRAGAGVSGPGSRSSYVPGSTSTGLLGSVRSYRKTLLVNWEAGAGSGPSATIT